MVQSSRVKHPETNDRHVVFDKHRWNSLEANAEYAAFSTVELLLDHARLCVCVCVCV